jgi:hypothetical protein
VVNDRERRMPVTGAQNRFCIIDGSGGQVVIRLQANQALHAGGDFSLEANDGTTIRDAWQMAAGDTGASDHVIGLLPPSLDGNTLRWEILCCSGLAGVDSGAVEVVVLQGGVSCPMTKPAHWDLTDVPDCETGTAKPIRASLTFRLK